MVWLPEKIVEQKINQSVIKLEVLATWEVVRIQQSGFVSYRLLKFLYGE